MTHGTLLRGQLAQWTAATDLLEINEEGLTVRAEVRDVDRLACVLGWLEVLAPARGAQNRPGPEALRAQADRLCGTITYLAESLRLVELLPDDGVAQLRSFPPEATAGTIRYVEILLRGGHTLSLRRYEYDKAQRARREIPLTLTNEILERLVTDLVEVMKGKEGIEG